MIRFVFNQRCRRVRVLFYSDMNVLGRMREKEKEKCTVFCLQNLNLSMYLPSPHDLPCERRYIFYYEDWSISLKFMWFLSEFIFRCHTWAILSRTIYTRLGRHEREKSIINRRKEKQRIRTAYIHSKCLPFLVIILLYVVSGYDKWFTKQYIYAYEIIIICLCS